MASPELKSSFAMDFNSLLDNTIKDMFPDRKDFVIRQALKNFKFKIIEDVYSADLEKSLSTLKYILKLMSVPTLKSSLEVLIKKYE